jgi:flagellar biosynthesis protein FlhG
MMSGAPDGNTEIPEQTMSEHLKIWSIGSGKGGVGKSIVTMGLGISLARLGKRVILLDADLGGANLHTLMGLRSPPVTLEDFLMRKVSRLSDVVVETPFDGIGLICGGDDILGAANPTYSQKVRLLRKLEDLPADFLLIDLAAGTSFNVLDLFNHSQAKIAVFTGNPTSLLNVYGFIKAAVFRKISREFAKDSEVLALLYEGGAIDGEVRSMDDLVAQVRRVAPEKSFRLLQIPRNFQVLLVNNMAKTDEDVRAAEIVESACTDFLRIKPQILGYLPFDPIVERAVNQMQPTLLNQRDNPIRLGLDQIAQKIVQLARQPRLASSPEEQESQTASPVRFG